MGLMTRIIKIFKADLHGIMDQFEDQGLLLKQHLRDMEEALNLKEAKLKNMLTSRTRAQKDYEKYNQQAEALEQDLAIAIQKNKDDIARVLIRKLRPICHLADEIAGHLKTLDDEISYCKNHLDQQRLQYEQLQHKAAAFFHNTQAQAWHRDVSASDPARIPIEPSDEEIELELLKRKAALGAV